MGGFREERRGRMGDGESRWREEERIVWKWVVDEKKVDNFWEKVSIFSFGNLVLLEDFVLYSMTRRLCNGPRCLAVESWFLTLAVYLLVLDWSQGFYHAWLPFSRLRFLDYCDIGVWLLRNGDWSVLTVRWPRYLDTILRMVELWRCPATFPSLGLFPLPK